MVAEECVMCRRFFHYDEDKPICRDCYHDLKEREYRYGKTFPKYYGKISQINTANLAGQDLEGGEEE